MSDIYGKLTENNDVPLDHSEHFTVTIRIHDFEQPPKRRTEPFCARCGFHKDARVHFGGRDG